MIKPPTDTPGAACTPRASLARVLGRVGACHHALVLNAPHAICVAVADERGGVLEANPAMLRLLGCGPADVERIGLTQDGFADPDEHRRLCARLRATTSARFETRWRTRDVTPLVVRVSAQGIHDDAGTLVGYEAMVEDLTEHRRLEEMARRSERMATLGTMLASAAHELNNPLAAVIGFAQLLLRAPLGDDQRAAVETIGHEATRSARIVRDLLALARQPESDEREPVDLNAVVSYIVRTRRYALESHGIGCDLRLDPHLTAVFGDRTKLEQVVLNLVTNAEHALRAAARRDPSAPRIAVRTGRDGDDVVLEVTDNGPGIPSDALGRVWDPFWTTRRDGQGTGLGLSVVQSIVAAHGGTIVVDAAPGGGARFTIRLPAPVSRDRLCSPASAMMAVGALDVLVIAPDDPGRELAARFLEARGHAVLTVADTASGLDLAARMAFDVVVCDAAIVAEHGCEVVASLRRSDTRVVLTVGDAHAASRLQVPLPPGVAVLLRPYDIEELRRLVEER